MIEAESPSASRRPVGFGGASATVIASMIGVGIFVSPGFTLDALQSPAFATAAWVVGGVIAICGAIAYGALAEELSESGGEYLYLSRKIHPWAGFVAGWTSLFAGFAGPTAAAALAFESYTGTSNAAFYSPLVAIALITGFAMLHSASTQLGSIGQFFLVATKVLLLVAGCIAMLLVATSNRGDVVAIAESPTASLDMGEFATSLMWIALSYTGFNAAIYIADDVHKPASTVPKALFWGTLITVALYIGLVTALFSTAGDPVSSIDAANELPGRVVDPFAHFLAVYFPETRFVGSAFRFVVALCLATSVSAMLLTGPRVVSKMAADRLFPSMLQTQSGSPPRLAIALQAAIAVGLVLSTTLLELLTHLGMTLSLCSATSIATLFLGRSTRLPVKVRLAAGLYIVATVVFAGLALRENPWNGAGAATVLVTASIAYHFFRPTERLLNQQP